MNTRRRIHLLAALAVALGLGLNASRARAGEIQNRKCRQQDRIAQGVRSGELTPRETARLENKEGALNHEERNMREINGGRLTAGDRAIINRQQNHLSRDIYRQKHDAQTDGF